MKKTLLALFSVALLAVAAPLAHASSITYDLMVDGCGGSGCGTPNAISGAPAGTFATVTLTQVGSNVTVLETLASNIVFVGTGAGNALEFNSGGTIDASSISAGYGIGPSPTKNGSFFGTFLDSISCTSCNGGSTTLPGPLSFTVDNVTLADFANGSTKGYLFASDIGELNAAGNLVLATGEVGGGTGTPIPNPTPEPSSLMLLGTGVLGAAGLMRRRMASAINR